MEEKQLMDFDVLTLGEGETADEDLQILFVLNGNVSVQMAESILHLGKGFLILHPFQVYSVKWIKQSGYAISGKCPDDVRIL